jgi:N-acetylmuramoyl-L-alanine amidase
MISYNEADAQKIIKFWKSKDLSDFAICGWLSNWGLESGFRSNNAQNSYMKKYGITDEEYTQRVDDGVWKTPDTNADFKTDKIGYGLSQWTSSGRKTGLYDYIKSKGVSISDMDEQLNYANMELNSKSYANTKAGLESAKSAGEAAIVIMTTYEKPASMNNPEKQKQRADLAEEFYQKYFADSVKPTKMILALSAGHYLYTPGKRCLKSIDPNETREWVLNSRIADKLTDILSRYEGIQVLRLDDPTGENPITLEERAKKSDEHDADFYLAIHHNAGINGGSGGGVTVYHYPTERNQEQAIALYECLVGENGLKGNRATPIKFTGDLYEVAAPKADSILVENGFMDSTTDTPIILTEDFADKSAKGLAEFFVNMWGLQLKQDGSASNLIAEIQSIRNNIKALEDELDVKLKELEDAVR